MDHILRILHILHIHPILLHILHMQVMVLEHIILRNLSNLPIQVDMKLHQAVRLTLYLE
jgi:hypothetical protein